MGQENSSASFTFDSESQCYSCKGSWTILHLSNVQERFLHSSDSTTQPLNISGKGIAEFDSAGALAILHFKKELETKGTEVRLTDFSKQQNALINLVEKKQESLLYKPAPPSQGNFFSRVGEETVYKLNQIDGFIILVGDLSTKIFAAFGHWGRFQLPSIISNIYSAGLLALPIVGLLSFLIGIVLAYQMGLQLQNYGVTNYIAYLSGLAVFREFGPLITAIIVAGRTSSAFTAQIGSMKINEELDALKTMGLSPTEYLVMPKVIALLFVFPLLIFWADLFGILGALYMSKWMLNVNYLDFLTRLKNSVGLEQFMLGLYKAPAFALLTALVGCFQGFRVNADSIGTQTTKSVVQALFLIIVADAVYSIIYSWLDL